jgi:riboflavin biosynthesis pyrimidine reductase
VKPYVICHMVASIDGRTLIRRWRPTDATDRAHFAELHERLAVDAWLVGRATGAAHVAACPGNSSNC